VSRLADLLVEEQDGAVVARVTGEIDLSNAATLERGMLDAVPNTAAGMVVDLTGVSYLDSAGINLLFAVGGDVRARQQELHLVVGPGSPIERMLQIVGADRTFPVHASLGEALAAMP